MDVAGSLLVLLLDLVELELAAEVVGLLLGRELTAFLAGCCGDSVTVRIGAAQVVEDLGRLRVESRLRLPRILRAEHLLTDIPLL